MKNKVYFIAILYLFLLVSGSLYSLTERVVRIGGDSGWSIVENRTGVTETSFVRPSTVLVISTTGTATKLPDLSISFDDGHPSLFRDSVGHYRVTPSPYLEAVDRRFARVGFGAALFPLVNDFEVNRARSDGPLVIEALNRNALFSPNNRFSDFTLEFCFQ